MASIGDNALQNMINIAEEFRRMIETNEKYSRYGVRIKPVKSIMTDVENRKKPGTRVKMIVHTLSVSVFFKPKVNYPGYQFDHKTDIGTIGK